ncbi:MAG: hypothetical protein IKX33_06340 [Prevotella sp.]|nr:hypothetical protein [Prevotella sp.]
MNVYKKPETEIVLCTELDSILQLKLSRANLAVEPGNAVDPWDPNAGLSEYNGIWDEEEEEEDLSKLKNK